MRLIAFLLFFAVAFSDEYLKGIHFYSSWQQANRGKMAEGIEVHDVCLLQENPKFLQSLQFRYLNCPLTDESLLALKQAIANFYQSEDRPFVMIGTCKKDLDRGILRVVVEEPKLGKITVKGNCYFPTSWFSDAMRSQLGQPIDTQTVLEDVAWLNLNPFRRTDAIYTPGDKPGLVDLELVAIDRWPYRVYAGADNTGTEATNRNRIFFGFNFGKSALKDGQISYQFTCAPNWNLYYSHTASARLPLPWRHVWVLWGGYASVKPHTHITHAKNEGISWQVDTRYRIPCFLSSRWLQTFVLGYDFKETNNEIHLDRVNIFDVDADINQFMLGYELGYRNPSRRATLNVELYFNPGGITWANRNSFYEQLQFDAQSQYAYVRLNHGFAQGFSLGWFTYDITAQWASANLLPSEQLTLTGYNAVRGYEERILNLDNALILNVACETPHWNPAYRWKFSKNRDELYFLAFFDYGMGARHHTPSNEDSFKNLASIGPGVRWQYDRYFTARFDYGFQLWHSGFHNPSNSRYNFGLILSY